MSYQFEFDSRNQILRARFEREATDEELKEYYRLAREYAPRIDPRACILDFSAVTSFEVSSQMIHDLAHSAPAMADPMRLRFVVAPTPHIFGMARMLQIEAEQTRPNLHVVQKLGEACAILGIQKLKFKPMQPSEPNVAEAIPTSESDQQLPAAVVSSESLEKQSAAERKAFLDKRLKIKRQSLRVWAKQAGVAVSTVAAYRSGKTNPHPSTLWKLAHALGISIEEMPR